MIFSHRFIGLRDKMTKIDRILKSGLIQTRRSKFNKIVKKRKRKKWEIVQQVSIYETILMDQVVRKKFLSVSTDVWILTIFEFWKQLLRDVETLLEKTKSERSKLSFKMRPIVTIIFFLFPFVLVAIVFLLLLLAVAAKYPRVFVVLLQTTSSSVAQKINRDGHSVNRNT